MNANKLGSVEDGSNQNLLIEHAKKVGALAVSGFVIGAAEAIARTACMIGSGIKAVKDSHNERPIDRPDAA